MPPGRETTGLPSIRGKAGTKRSQSAPRSRTSDQLCLAAHDSGPSPPPLPCMPLLGSFRHTGRTTRHRNVHCPALSACHCWTRGLRHGATDAGGRANLRPEARRCRRGRLPEHLRRDLASAQQLRVRRRREQTQRMTTERRSATPPLPAQAYPHPLPLAKHHRCYGMPSSLMA